MDNPRRPTPNSKSRGLQPARTFSVEERQTYKEYQAHEERPTHIDAPRGLKSAARRRGLLRHFPRRKLNTTTAAILLVLVFSRGTFAADEARTGAELVRKGNTHLAAGKYRQALSAYDKAQEKLPDSAVVAYDRGLALYRLGRFDDAETAFQDALQPERPDLEEMAKYNLGRCAHAAALAKQDDLPKAINDLSRAIGFYKDALQLRPDDQDAKHNAALAERLQGYLKKRLQQQKQKEKKKKSGPTSKPSDKNNDQNKQGDDQQQGENQQQSPNDQQDKQQGKQKNRDQPPSTQPNQEQPPATQPSPEPEQKPASQPSAKPKPQPTTRPSSATSRPAEENRQQTMQRISLEQAMRMLQEARDAELKRREKKRAIIMQQRGRMHVDKDW